jgi:hypothetical protein
MKLTMHYPIQAKKSNYDSQFTISYATPIDYRREANKMKYYQWQRMQQKHYVIDKEYFKIQVLAFLVFTVIAGFCFALIHSAQYYSERQQLGAFPCHHQCSQTCGYFVP